MKLLNKILLLVLLSFMTVVASASYTEKSASGDFLQAQALYQGKSLVKWLSHQEKIKKLGWEASGCCVAPNKSVDAQEQITDTNRLLEHKPGVEKGKEISQHPFSEGGSHITTTDKVNNYPDSPTYGGPDGLYVAPKSQIDDLLKNSNTRKDIEVNLGLNRGSLEGGELIRIDVPNALDKNLRLPGPKTGNVHHRPNTGLTTGGLNEAVIDSPSKLDKAIDVTKPKLGGED